MSPAAAMKPSAIPATKARAAHILHNAVCLVLHRHYLGNRRKIDVDEIIDHNSDESERVDSDQISAIKRLIDRKEIKPVMRVQYQVRAFLLKSTLPASNIFGESAYLIPNAAVETVVAKLTEFEAKLHEEAVLLSERYLEAVARQKVALGKHFNPKDYVTPKDVINAWGMDWNFVSFDAPDRLNTVNSALFEIERSKSEQRWADSYMEVRLILRQTLLEVVKAIGKKLTPGTTDGGKKKYFKDSVLDDLTEFFENFHIRNITDDADLANVVDNLKQLTNGVEPDQLRDMQVVRAKVTKGIETATKQLDKLVVTHRRLLSFDDD